MHTHKHTHIFINRYTHREHTGVRQLFREFISVQTSNRTPSQYHEYLIYTSNEDGFHKKHHHIIVNTRLRTLSPAFVFKWLTSINLDHNNSLYDAIPGSTSPNKPNSLLLGYSNTGNCHASYYHKYCDQTMKKADHSDNGHHFPHTYGHPTVASCPALHPSLDGDRKSSFLHKVQWHDFGTTRRHAIREKLKHICSESFSDMVLSGRKGSLYRIINHFRDAVAILFHRSTIIFHN